MKFILTNWIAIALFVVGLATDSLIISFLSGMVMGYLLTDVCFGGRKYN